MTETEIADFGDGLAFSTLTLLFEDQDVVNFDISVNDATLVHVADSGQHILCPDCHLLVMHRLVLG